MKKDKYPKSDHADICFILEGTYPFSKGGVSNWVYEIIRVFPQYRFALIFLGTRQKDYSGLEYPLLENIVHLDAYYLYDKRRMLDMTSKKIKKKTMKKIGSMHDKFQAYTSSQIDDMSELFDFMRDNKEINKKQFLRSREAWEYIEERYKKNYSNQSFFDYFWGIRNLHEPFWLLKKIVDHVPRVKILHSASTGYAGFLGALLQKKYGVPYILTEHGLYTKERWIELMRNYFFEKVTRQKNLLHNEQDLSNMWVNFFKILAKIGYSRANPIISLLEDYRQVQIKDGALPERTRTISYGINFDHYKFLGKTAPNQENPIIAFIGRVVPIKDVKTFVRAMALVIQKKPAVTVWIVGPLKEDPEYVESCRNLIGSFGLQEKIQLLGYQNVMEIYPKIDLVVLSSISEGSPFTILESFAVGIPVVATDVGGCKELILGKQPEDQSYGASGRLVNIADPDGIANAALELLNDQSAWYAAQQAGLKRVRAYYSMQTLIENYSIIYKEAMSTWQE